MKTNYYKNTQITTLRWAVFSLLLSFSTISWGQIAAWQFGTPASIGDEGVRGATMYNPHIVQPILLRGDGIQAYALGRGFSSINWLISGTDKYESAVSINNYYEFTIQSEAHYKVSISSISARLRRSANGPSRYQWAYKINNTPNFVQIGSSYSTLDNAVDEGELITVNTSSIADLQAKYETDESPLVIRLYAWYALEETGTFAFGRTPVGTSTNSLAINGTVIPVIAKPVASTISATTDISASNIQSTSAIVFGQITDLGYPKATHHGFCWSTNPTPVITDNKVDFGEPTSTYQYMSTLENLTPNTSYYFRSYAINTTNVEYGQALSFKTKVATTPKDIAINFTGSGSASSVGSVTVENLTTRETKTISGDAVLYLNPSGATPIPTIVEAIYGNQISKMTVYPNPATASSTLSFSLAEKGDVRVNICDISGKVISHYSDYLTTGSYKFQLPALQSGIYFVSLVENGNKRTQKLVSVNNNVGNLNPIQNIEKTELAAIPTNKPQKVNAAVAANEGMVFNIGNQLRFTASSGRNKTIIMDSPSKSKTVDVRFIECIDGDNNAYPVVKVGTLYWMAENLKTTKKTDGTALSKATGAAWAALTSTSDAYCYLGDADANAAKYGALYTYHAANSALAPTGGWRLPTKMECIKLAGYLEGKERAGVKLKEAGTANWTADNVYATNQSGFNALPAGMRVGATFSATGTTAAFWTSTTSTNKTEAAIAKLTSNQDSISINTDTVQTAGLSVRYVFEVPDLKPKQMEDEFGKDPDKVTNFSEKLPLPKNTVLMAPDKELFFTGRHNTSLSPQLRFMDNPAATSAPYITGLPAIATGAVKWWENPKKVTTMVNENGRESTVIAVWNEAEAGAISGYKNITLHIIGDESVNYAHQSIVLPDKFWMPTIVSGTAYNGQTMNAYDIQECWQWEMTVRTGDINNDGTPDILMAVHDTLRIYDGKTFARISQRGFYEDFNQSKNFAFFLRTEVADVDQDGRNDVVVMTSTPKSFALTSTDDSKCARLHMFLNGNINLNDPAVYKNAKLGNLFSIGADPDYARTANFTIGDINTDGTPEIVIVYSFNSGNALIGGNVNRGLVYTNYDKTAEKPFNFKGNPGIVSNWSDFSQLQPIALAKLKGPAGPNYIIDGNIIVYINSSGEAVTNDYPESASANYTTYKYNTINKEYRLTHYIYGDQMVVGNFDKNPSGREMIYYMVNISAADLDITNTANLNINSASLDQTTGEVIFSTTSVPYFNENSSNLLSKNHFPVIAAVNTRHTGRLLQFERHQYMLTKPKLIAALAAAPYLEGYYDTNANPSTSWIKSDTKAIGNDTLATHTATAIVGFEHKFEVPFIGTQIGGIEFTAKAAMSFSKNYASEVKSSITAGYSGGKEDMAIVTSTPYDAFFYKILKSENPDEINTEVMFGFPRELLTQAITVENYNKMVEGQNAPIIDKSIFRHTPGNPFSYPNGTTTKLSNLPAPYSAEYMTGFTGVGQGWATLGLGNETTTTVTTGFSQDYEFELVASVGDFKLGGGYGYNKEKTESTSVGSSIQVQGIVPGLLNYSSSNNKYNWALKWYNYQKSGFIFQVVNYVVTNQ